MLLIKDKKWLYLFLLPTFLLFGIIYIASFATLFTTSFTDWTIAGNMNFVGLENYQKLLFENKDFLKSILNTCIWIFLMATVHVLIGVLVALVLAQKQFYWKFVRTVYMIPNIISSAALGMLFLSIYNPDFGIVNSLIRTISGKDFSHNWFMSHSTSFITVTLTWLPYAAVVSILVLAEIASISESIIESAKVDGASNFQINIYILLPLLKNIIGTTSVLAATSMLQKVDIIMLTTGGGPGNETMNLPMFIYMTAMRQNQFGVANAAGVMLIGIGALTIFLISRVFKIGSSHQ